LFKLSSAPFHAWAPDTYEGSPLSSTIIFSIFPKLPIVVALSRILFECFYSFNIFWEILISFCAILSIIFGTLGAIHQSKIKRFLVYSSIGHVGYFLIALTCGNLFGLTSCFFYLFVYILTSVIIWFSFSTLNVNPFLSKKRSLKFFDQFVILSRENNSLALLFTVAILSIAGIPPLLGFFCKMDSFFFIGRVLFFFYKFYYCYFFYY
jgi:NADH-quinone oxidoreductase subunit N